QEQHDHDAEGDGLPVVEQALGQDRLQADREEAQKVAAEDRPFKLSIPPNTEAMKAIRTGWSPTAGSTSEERPTQKSDTMPAMKPLIAKATAITPLARTPRSRAMVKSSADARSAMPMIVRRRKTVSTPSRIKLTARLMRSTALTR